MIDLLFTIADSENEEQAAKEQDEMRPLTIWNDVNNARKRAASAAANAGPAAGAGGAPSREYNQAIENLSKHAQVLIIRTGSFTKAKYDLFGKGIEMRALQKRT